MHWNVQLGGKSVEVDLPDGVPTIGSFRVIVKGQTYLATFDPVKQGLQLEEPNATKPGLAARPTWQRRFALRRMEVVKVEGDAERQVHVEFSGGGLPETVSFAALARPSVPGIGAVTRETAHKALTIRSPMAGKVLKICVAVGALVETGQTLAIVEAMKMENKVLCLRSGTVTAIKVKEGSSVTVAQELIRID